MPENQQYAKRRTPFLPFNIILAASVIAGTIDIMAAFLDYYLSTGKNPAMTIPKYIASGLFGKRAFAGGAAMVFAGLVFHYMISFGASFVLFLVCLRTRFLQVNWILRGVVYGMLVWVVTALVIVPLSNVAHPPMGTVKVGKLLKAMLIVIVAIGLPISYIAKRYFEKSASVPEPGNLPAI